MEDNMLLNCFFDGSPSPLFEKLPKELLTMIFNYVKPEYVFIAKYSNRQINTLMDFEEILIALAVADAVCDISDEANDLDALGFVFRILKKQYFIVTSNFLFFQVVGGEKIKYKNIKTAFQVLNLDPKYCKFKSPKPRDLALLFNNNYITYHYPF